MLKPVSAFAAALILASTVCVSGAQAFGWGYNPATGSNFGYLARSVLYGSGLYRGGYGAPGYLVNSLVWNGAYAVGQGFNTARAKSAANNFAQNGQPVGNGFMMSNGVVDQIAPAKWRPSYTQPVPPNIPNNAAAPASAEPFSEPDMDPTFMPIPQSGGIDSAAPLLTPPVAPAPIGGAASVPQSVASELPPVAPDVVQSAKPAKTKKAKKVKERKSQPQQIAAAPTTATPGKSPFAGALVDHINKNFDGDIGKALNDKETSKFARAIGLIQENQTAADVPADRVDLVRKILADPTDEPDLKVQAVRLLLKHQ